MSDPEALSAQKAALRKTAFARRKTAHGLALDEAANSWLCEILLNRPRAIIAGYMPIRTEIDPLPSMHALHAKGHEICIPVITGADKPLEFHRWTPETTLVGGAFGAKVPAEADRLVPDILIQPLVAFDDNFVRLGYGGGYYDRSLAEIRAEKNALAIGFAYAAQELPALPRGPFDILLDAVVSETETRWRE